MNKQEYLTNLRETSAYPKYRLVVTTLTVLAYIGCVGFGIVSLIALFNGEPVAGIGGLIIAAIAAFVLIPFHRDVMNMGSDIADALLDRNLKDGRSGGEAV